MSNLPEFLGSDIAEIDEAIQEGRGAAASVLGQTYNVFRLGPTSNVSVISGTPVYTDYPVRIRKSTKVAIENASFDLLAFTSTTDNRFLQIGDFLVESGYEAEEGNVFVVAQIRPTRETIIVRVESASAIQRPTPYGGSAAEQPVTPGQCIVADGYGGITPFNREQLSLTNGVYAFFQPGAIDPRTKQPAVQASVPIGIQPRSRTRDRREPDLPTRIAESEFYMYVPQLPGVEIVEMDVIKAAHEDNYECRGVYTSDDAGLHGFVVLARKLAS